MKRISLIVALHVPALILFAQPAVRTGEITRGIFYQEGIASWYGGEFNGRPTASGEIFDDTRLTAAHPILPFGTMLKITNRHNNKSVIVRVNDRGPFVAERILDLSRTAAQELDMIRTGTAPVIVESLQELSLPLRNTLSSGTGVGGAPQPAALAPAAPAPAPAAQPAAPAPAAPAAPAPAAAAQPQPASAQGAAPAPAAPASAAQGTPWPAQNGEVLQIRPAPVESYSDLAPGSAAPDIRAAEISLPQSGTPALLRGSIPGGDGAKLYRIQVGAYIQPRNAVDAFEKLKNAGLNPAYEKYNEYYRVVLSGIKNADLRSVAEKLGQAGFREAIIKEESPAP
ncbi:MAG: septal ring lytic transglycosylase RlpA family protein [Spirochaetaceae bacterium]|jgi:rare lipoprotein A|nr:septal ring lytic transglycosylase RlpA family protein [Spirochaetaceae bacterium]